MMTPDRKTIPSRRVLVAWVMTLCVAGLLVAMAQQPQEEETTRQLWDTAFINQGNKQAARRTVRRNYRIVTPQVPVTRVSAETVIGVTLWRLRPTRPADTGERIITTTARNRWSGSLNGYRPLVDCPKATAFV